MISTSSRLSLMIVSPNGDNHWTQEIADYFTLAGEPPAIAVSVDAAWDAIHSACPNAIIAVGHQEANYLLLRAVREEFPSPPVLILVATDGAPPFDGEQFADAITPPMGSFIEWHIHKALQDHAERAQQQERHDSLQAEVDQSTQELDKLRQAATEVDLLKNAIVRNVSHELRTPLLQVKSAVKLMTEDIDHPTLGNLALAATARLESVVSNVTQLAQSMDELNIVPMLVRDCVNYALNNLRRTWEHKEDMARISVHMDEMLPPVMGDRQSISTVMQLLIDNALKFSKQGIEIHVHVVGEEMEISVRDYGIGIPKSKRQAIFDTFFQIDSSTIRRYGGIGVGLSIVKMILERHGVQTQVESQEGVGSTFSFRLPIANLSLD